MPRIPVASEDHTVRALKEAGLVVLRQGKHVVMSNGYMRLTIPRHNPINAYTMGADCPGQTHTEKCLGGSGDRRGRSADRRNTIPRGSVAARSGHIASTFHT
jgi:hypothetical protein